MDEIYPLTILLDRYGGCYSGGEWTAWNYEPNEVPLAPFLDDVTCMMFWQNNVKCGIGDSPEAAIIDLKRKLSEK